MPRLARPGIILAMAHPLTSSKLLLVAEPRPAASAPGAARIRRYRLARLRLDGRAMDPALRFEHLKRVYE
jgi:hypothetical protein